MKRESLEKEVGGSHYKEFKVQPIQFFVENHVEFIQGCVIKYILRYKFKNGREDLEKAIHYCELGIELKDRRPIRIFPYGLKKFCDKNELSREISDIIWAACRKEWGGAKELIKKLCIEEYGN